MTPPHSTLRDSVVAILEEARLARAFPGAQVWLGCGDTVLLHESFGLIAYEDEATNFPVPPVSAETLYDIASLSKLWTLAAFLLARRVMNLDVERRVREFLPEFDRADKRDITLRQLLNHSSGIGFAIQALVPGTGAEVETPTMQAALAAEARRAVAPEKWIGEIARAPLAHAPGSKVLYSCTNYFLLARLVEMWTNQSLTEVLWQKMIQPLGLKHTTNEPLKYFAPCQIAPTERVSPTEFSWCGVVHDEAARQWAWQTGGVCGNAGLFSTASDLARFACLWLREGAWENRQLLHAEDVRATFIDTIPENQSTQRGWCWQLDAQYFMSDAAPVGSAGHTGFTGPTLWLHPHTQHICIIVNNRVHPTRHGPNRMPYHRRIAETLLAHTA
jgi:CubicO group peptidase (beta-lactamase class C family)